MNKLNKLPMALTILGLGAAASFAEVKVSDNLSLTGFLDMSANGIAPDSGDATLAAKVDQFELDFMLKYGFFSARADINSIGPTGAVTFEQGFITAALTQELSMSIGKFLSCSGFEAAEPTGLYQYSVSKLLSGYAGATYGGYENGMNLAYSTPKFALYGAVLTSVWSAGGETDLLTPGFEAQIALMPAEGITAKVTYLMEMFDDTTPADHDMQSEINAWVSYAKGPLTVAAEFSYLMDWVVKGETGMGYLGMANYKLTDKVAATVRYSAVKMESADDPDSEITFSPSFAVSSNWLALAEYRYNIDAKSSEYAAESTFSF
ncbi:MAG: outer membrane beta-barrel protein [Fibrobacteria bacterium]